MQKLPLAIISDPPEAAHQHDVADYIAAITFELRQMAICAALPEVTVSLEQVYYQAFQVAERLAHSNLPPQPQVER